jgi:hypothetical protein
MLYRCTVRCVFVSTYSNTSTCNAKGTVNSLVLSDIFFWNNRVVNPGTQLFSQSSGGYFWSEGLFIISKCEGHD